MSSSRGSGNNYRFISFDGPFTIPLFIDGFTIFNSTGFLYFSRTMCNITNSLFDSGSDGLSDFFRSNDEAIQGSQSNITVSNTYFTNANARNVIFGTTSNIILNSVSFINTSSSLQFIYTNAGTLQLSGVQILNASTSITTSGLIAINGAALTASNTVLRSTSAYMGSAFYLTSSTATLQVFSLLVWFSLSSQGVTIESSVSTTNGAIYASNSQLTISNSSIRNCSGVNGSAIFASNSVVDLISSILTQVFIYLGFITDT